MKSTLPSVLMRHACQFGAPVRLMEPRDRSGNVTLLELLVINHLAARISPSVVFEMGTFDGRTTLNLAANSAPGAKIFTLDLPPSEINNTALPIENGERSFVDKKQSGSRFSEQFGFNIVQLYGDTATFDFSPWYESVDFVFIDASHALSYVQNDTEIALRLIRKGGFLIWHDYEAWEGVTEALNEFGKNDDRLKNLEQIHGTTLAICGSARLCPIPTAEEVKQAQSYWDRYPDVVASDYSKNGRLGIWGALGHYEDFGEEEGREWAV